MNLNTPKPFNPQADRIGKDWQLWKKEFMIFLKLSGGYEKYSEEYRSYLLVNLIGTEGIKAMEKMTFDHPNEKNDMDILIMKFDEIFDPPLNEVEERFKFFSRRKRENETIENFAADLKEIADTCNFGTQSNKFIIDMIIRNVDNYLRKIIFALNDITIPDLIQYYNQYSANTDKIKEITKNSIKPEFSNKKPERNNCWRCNTRHEQRNCPAFGTMCNVCREKNHFSGMCKKESTNSKKTEIPQKRICSKCGTNHPYQQCPAYNYICYKCGTKGHYGNRCKNRPVDFIHNDEKLKKATETKNKSTVTQNDQKEKDLQHCLWCGLKHSQGQCQHASTCTRCEKFPHNICFNCRKNPHEISCYYRTIITLPLMTLDLSSSAQKTSLQTENKDKENSSNKNSVFSTYCDLCFRTGDHHSTCPRKLNNNQTKPSQSDTADPLLKDYVNIHQNIPKSDYQGSTSCSNQTTPDNYYRNIPKSDYQRSPSHPNQRKPDADKNNSQFQNKKRNEKSDCSIS